MRCRFPNCTSFTNVDPTLPGACTRNDLLTLKKFVDKHGTHIIKKTTAGGTMIERILFNRNAPGFQNKLMRSGGELDIFIRDVVAQCVAAPPPSVWIQSCGCWAVVGVLGRRRMIILLDRGYAWVGRACM